MATNVATGRRSIKAARERLAESIPISPEALSLGAWLLAILSAELAIHGVGEPFYGAMTPFLLTTVAVAVLAGQRYRHTRMPHWLLASFAATFITLNGFLSAFTNIGVTLHDVHYASDFAALGTAFFLMMESFTPGLKASRSASLASFLACCGFMVILPALFFGLGPISLSQLVELINSESAATILAIPAWVPFIGLAPAVAGLYLGNAGLGAEESTSVDVKSAEGASCRTDQVA